jgi:hypothetical protein
MLKRQDFDYRDSPWEVTYFEALPMDRLPCLCLDFGGGGGDASGAITQAANISAQASREAAGLEKQIYEEIRGDVAPWRTAGTGAVNYLSGILNIPGSTPVDPTNALRATPGYNWAMGQGVDARERSAAARGGLLGTPEQKSLTTFGQGLADQTYQNYLNNLFNVSGSGLTAAGMGATAGMNYANQAGQMTQNAANTTAQSILAAYNAQQMGKQSGYGALGSALGLGAGVLMAPFTGGTSLLGSGISTLSGLMGGGGTSALSGGADLASNYANMFGSFGY